MRPAHALGSDSDPVPDQTPANDAPNRPNGTAGTSSNQSLSNGLADVAHASGIEPRAVDPGAVTNNAAVRTDIFKDAVTSSKQALSASGALPSVEGAGATDSPLIASLPTGADKTGVSSQAISVPSGAGKIQGMGESFSAQLSTGIATFNVPIALPAARGTAQPSLSLSYSSGAGHGVAGIGWSIGVPFIARQTDRGIPKYKDPQEAGPWHPEQDRFVFNGGQELVPICQVGAAGECPGALPDEAMPDWGAAWQYFRPRVEGSFQRFFWSPDHRTWRVQDKSGVTMELGVALDGAGDPQALEVDPRNALRIYRWNLSREFDAHVEAKPPPGAKARPVNIVAFRYATIGGESYVTDIYDTPPSVNAAAALLSEYAHHTRLVYEARPDAELSFRRGWETATTQRLAGIDVTSKTFDGDVTSARRLVRRYHLAYDPDFHVSLLKSVQMEGRCAGDERDAPSELPDQTLGPTSCERLPPMTFDYQHVAPFTAGGQPGTKDLAGYEGFDERLHAMANSPDHSVDEELADLFDINADGLPDVLVTAPALFAGKHGVFLNGGQGKPDNFAPSTVSVLGVLGADANSITLKNQNVSPQDLDGDGIIDLLHMPQVKTYSVYTPKLLSSKWTWVGRTVTTAAAQSPKIDFGRDTLDLKVMDVNADGLVDVVFSGGTTFQTFLSLGRYPGGDGQFGHAVRTGPGSANISNDPLTACVPWDSTPVRFSDADIKLGDMNGDGLVDIVRIRRSDIRYWPGRGNGVWGTGRTDDCVAGTFGPAHDILMAQSPQFSDIQGDSLRLDDVNGDGLDDLVQVRFDAVDVWLNVDGTAWTPNRHVLHGTPPSPSFANRVRLVDVNGSGTRDILWGDGLKYQYIDLAGGQRPWVLVHVANGLGKTTDLEYTTSTALMLAAERDGKPWSSKAPMPLHVVSRVTESDNLDIVGRQAGRYVTEYTYRDAVYEGRQREFRGFRSTEVRREGDANSPTAITSTAFLLGDCKDEDPKDSADPCVVDGGWRDNPREALKGLPSSSETRDEAGVYLFTEHHTYRLRRLYVGVDGREVRDVFESTTDQYLYDTGPFVAASSTVSLADVELDLGTSLPTQESPNALTLRSAAGRAHIRHRAVVDRFGNATDVVAEGCIEGCPEVDEIITGRSLPGRPTGDMSGWMWRTVESYVTGSRRPLEKRARHLTTYNALGDPTTKEADLFGTLSVDRFRINADGSHDTSPGVVAPLPSDASTDGLIVLERDEYEEMGLGNVVRQTGAGDHCRAVVFDTVYAHLPIEETLFAGPAQVSGCGSKRLKASAKYDRAFAAPIEVTDLHGERTAVRRNSWGWLTEITKPDPSVVGAVSALPAMKVDYFLATDPIARPYSLVRVDNHDGATPSSPSYRSSWGYQDGFGRTIVRLDQADPDVEGGAAWVANGLTEYDAKGAASRAYRAWFYNGSPESFPLSAPPPSAYGSQRYDAFGRILQTFDLDGSVSLHNVYHALSSEAWDAEDLRPGPHQGTPAGSRRDGHGRTVITIERSHDGNRIDVREMRTNYLPTSEIESITRTHPASADPPIVRWHRYDSLGRMVLNVEPNTTRKFQSSLSADPATMNAWRYAYNDAGDLVGTSDARGCGVNYIYDSASRMVAEDYSPCSPSHAAYSELDLATLTGIEVLYRYDDQDPDATSILANAPSFTIDPTLLLGRLVSVSDRSSKTLTRYDGRGRTTGVARRLAKPGAPAEALANRYAPHWYTQSADFDGADRAIRESMGVDVPELLGGDGKSTVETSYNRRGTIRKVAGSYGDLVVSATHDADGFISTLQYGDAAHTTVAYQYDSRHRLRSVQSYRAPPEIWKSPPSSYQPAPTYGSGAPSTFQLLLEDVEYTYDAVNDPVEIRDWRIPDEWPPGAKPVTRKIDYDDLYRVISVAYQYPQGDDPWTSPFSAEDSGDTGDPRRALPSPHVSFAKRVLSQKYQYDWLGNTRRSDDDANGFFDRSLGTITNGTASRGPYQLQAASNETTGSTRSGHLSAKYDDAGNLIGLAVRRNGPCLPAGALCSQRYAYDWDEVGRLVAGRRWDLSSVGGAGDPEPTVTPTASLAYAYDAGDRRILKAALDAIGTARYTAYVFPSLELRRTSWTGTDYERTALTEVPFLFTRGVRVSRIAYEDPDVPTPGGLAQPRLHVFLELTDHLGSTSLVIDKATGELVEETQYQTYGATESDYRPERWKNFREDYRFTGKEEDIEVGLAYFGARYYAPLLGRWTSADPLTIHQMGADANAYAYVRGDVFKATDPVGLMNTNWNGAQHPAVQPTYDPAIAIAKGAANFAVHTVQGTADVALRMNPATGPVIFAVDAYNYGLKEAAKRACVACTVVQGAVGTYNQGKEAVQDYRMGRYEEALTKGTEVTLTVVTTVVGGAKSIKSASKAPKVPPQKSPDIKPPNPAPAPPAEHMPVVDQPPKPPTPSEPVAAKAEVTPAPAPEVPTTAAALERSGTPQAKPLTWSEGSARHALDRHSPLRPAGPNGKGTTFPTEWGEEQFLNEVERIANDPNIASTPVPAERGGVGHTKLLPITINGVTRRVLIVLEVPHETIPGSGSGTITTAYPPHKNK